MRKMQGKPPIKVEQPEYSYIANEVLIAFSMIEKSRSFIGQMGTPAPLSLRDINDYADRFEIPCDYSLFCRCIFEIDDIVLKSALKQMKENRPSK